MVARLVNFILTRTALGRYLDGKKTYISTALTVAAIVLELLERLVTLFPDYAPLAVGAKELATFLDAASETLAFIGIPGVVVGVGHKVAKAKLAKE